MDGVLDWLPGLFERRTEHGDFAYTDEELRELLAAMILAFGYRPEDLTPPVERLLAGLAVKAGVDPEGSREDAEATLRRYFAEHPINPVLVRDFQHHFRAALVDVSGSTIAEVFSKYLETGERKLAFEPRAEPKEGAVRGGPLGFFLAKKKLDE